MSLVEPELSLCYPQMRFPQVKVKVSRAQPGLWDKHRFLFSAIQHLQVWIPDCEMQLCPASSYLLKETLAPSKADFGGGKLPSSVQSISSILKCTWIFQGCFWCCSWVRAGAPQVAMCRKIQVKQAGNGNSSLAHKLGCWMWGLGASLPILLLLPALSPVSSV